MAVTLDGQVEVNGLLLGPGTNYVVRDFKPYTRGVRHSTQAMAWGAGGWSGREDTEVASIPLRVEIDTDTQAQWMAARSTLAAALKASSADVELRWQFGGIQHLMYVRPRLVDPEVENVGVGWGLVECALVALDPRVYSGDEHSVTVSLPKTTGGKSYPHTYPNSFSASTIAGRVSINNAGTLEAGLLLRFDAFGTPLQEPRVSVTAPDGTVTELRAKFTLAAGQWLVVDTRARTAYLNGLTTASRRSDMYGDFPLLEEGVSDLSFDAAVYSATAQLTATWKDTNA